MERRNPSVGIIAFINGDFTPIAYMYVPITVYVKTINNILLVPLVSQALSDSTFKLRFSIFFTLDSSPLSVDIQKSYQTISCHAELVSASILIDPEINSG